MGMKFKHTAALIRDRREKRKVKQAELTEELGYAHPQFISNFEMGRTPLPIEKIKEAANFLKISKQKIREALHHDFDDHVKKLLAG